MHICTMLQNSVIMDKTVRLFVEAYGILNPRAVLDMLVDVCS